MGLIKAQIAPQAVRFQWRDVEADAAKVIAEAQRRGEEIIADAQASADDVRQEARESGQKQGMLEGSAAGRAQGLEQGIAAAAQELQLAVASLNEAATIAVAAKEQVIADSVGELVELAIAIAQRVIKRQAAIDPQVLIANLRDALALCGRQRQLRIAIHPSQKQMLAEALPRLEMEWPAAGSAQIVEDAAISMGGCRIFTDHGQINADLNAQLDRIIAELTPPRSLEEKA
jgi:flagellar assembly protein FliH